MPTVSKFLFCLTLETGGLVLGYVSAFFAALGVLTLAILFFLNIITGHFTAGQLTSFLIFYLLNIAYYCVVFYASVMLVRGTKNVSLKSDFSFNESDDLKQF